MKIFRILTLLAAATAMATLTRAAEPASAKAKSPVDGSSHHRVLVSSDIGGTDPDDLQSMVHLLVYADSFELEGLVSSPTGSKGRKEHIIEVIDLYERDYTNLITYSDKYPTPGALRAITKQGATETSPAAGFAGPTEGSAWIIQCARSKDPRPLHVLVWGGIDDLAQALHDAPDILPKLRVYWIGGPNKKHSTAAYNYIEQNHPKLWIIEANTTYRGWFVGGNQTGEWGNNEFVTQHIAGRGALGEFFATLLKGRLKMGDTPSVAWLLHGNPQDPSQPGWGGKFVRVQEQPVQVSDQVTTAEGLVAQASARRPNWWTDDPDPALAEGKYPGAKTVSRWREEFLGDFAARMDRCKAPAKVKTQSAP